MQLGCWIYNAVLPDCAVYSRFVPSYLSSAPPYSPIHQSTGIAIAFTHLAVFLHLNGKYEGDPGIPSQTHVTAGATIVATIFSFSVRTTLAVVFTQYFWRLVRISPLNFGTVEALYTLRSNPLWGFRRAILREGALLVVLACIIWLVPLATTFPPSSMTLESATQAHSNLTGVPTFNADSVSPLTA